MLFRSRTDHQVKIRGFRVELGEIEATLAHLPQVAQAAVIAREDTPGHKQLVGYAIAQAGHALDAMALRRTLAELLPDYMLPAAIVVLDALPLSPNGKLDRAALPSPDYAHPQVLEPRTPQEAALAELFAEVLGLPQVGIEDNFFELGGDSIRSIQLVSRARQRGWLIKPRDIFSLKTVEALAQIATRSHDETATQPDASTGGLLPTPVMRWFLKHGGRGIETFHQSVVLRAPADVTLSSLLSALQALIDHHDMLRLKVVRDTASEPARLTVQEPGQIDASACMVRIDVSGHASPDWKALLDQHQEHVQRGLALHDARTLQALWFDAGPQREGRLLLAIHHMVVDSVSWSILVPDLAEAHDACSAGRAPMLPAKTTSFRRWSDLLHAEADAPRRTEEIATWKRMLGDDAVASMFAIDPVLDRVGTSAELSLRWPITLTQELLLSPARLNGQINELLLTAFALALARWQARLGASAGRVHFDLEGHGREDIFDGVDVSRTVGWFTTLYPVCVPLQDVDATQAMAGADDIGRAFRIVKEQLRSLPDHGLGYGLLSELSAHAAVLQRQHPALASFNYLGRFDAPRTLAWSMADDAERLSSCSDPDMPLFHAIALNALVEESDDGPCLIAHWNWAARLFDQHDMASLADDWFGALEALIAFAQKPGTANLTPSDMPLLSMNQDDIDYLESLYASRD